MVAGAVLVPGTDLSTHAAAADSASIAEAPAAQGWVVPLVWLRHAREFGCLPGSVRAADGAEAVGDDEGDALFEHALDGTLNGPFGLGVNGAGGFVHDEDLRVGEDGAGESDKLFLAGGKPAAAFADLGVVAVGQCGDEFVGVDALCRFHNLVVARAEFAVTDVVANRAREQVRLLEDDAELGLQPAQGALAVIDAVDEDLPVFPPPVGPTRAMDSPAWTVRLKLRRTC